MALASLEDVNRILGYTDGDNEARDAKIRASLEAVSDIIAGKLRNFGRAGRNVQTYHDIPAGSTLALPTSDCTVVAVRVNGTLITNYEITDGGDLLLSRAVSWPGLAGDGGGQFYFFQDAAVARETRVWSTVEVFYISTGVLPRAVAEGVAFMAAGYYRNAPATLAGLDSEKIGDYSYTRKSGASTEYVDTALRFLTPFFKGSRVSVT